LIDVCIRSFRPLGVLMSHAPRYALNLPGDIGDLYNNKPSRQSLWRRRRTAVIVGGLGLTALLSVFAVAGARMVGYGAGSDTIAVLRTLRGPTPPGPLYTDTGDDPSTVLSLSGKTAQACPVKGPCP